ncbi:MAG: heparan-alpha-glucosaminide N-acetyltransferase domain-containing protein [Dyadobacter fermentans]
MNKVASSSLRLDSIDVFRAVTMFLMIFVNDFWTLEGVPEWLEHSKAEEDAMGLSDVVFPAFLFIVGLSIRHIQSQEEG